MHTLLDLEHFIFKYSEREKVRERERRKRRREREKRGGNVTPMPPKTNP